MSNAGGYGYTLDEEYPAGLPGCMINGRVEFSISDDDDEYEIEAISIGCNGSKLVLDKKNPEHALLWRVVCEHLEGSEHFRDRVYAERIEEFGAPKSDREEHGTYYGRAA